MDTRTEIMRNLLLEKEGLTIDELSRRLGISRSGMQQQIAILQRDGFVYEQYQRNPGTGGRPSRVFALTSKGQEQFPRQYTLLSNQVLKKLKESVGQQALLTLLESVADDLYTEHAHRVEGKEQENRIHYTVDLMNDLGYEATPLEDNSGVRAVNCVFHQLASEVREVCHFDVELLGRLMGSRVDHVQCMIDGDHACVFKINSSKGA